MRISASSGIGSSVPHRLPRSAPSAERKSSRRIRSSVHPTRRWMLCRKRPASGCRMSSPRCATTRRSSRTARSSESCGRSRLASRHDRGAQGQDHLLRRVRLRVADTSPGEGPHARVRSSAVVHRADPMGGRHVRGLCGRSARPFDGPQRGLPRQRDHPGCGANPPVRLVPEPHTFHVVMKPLDTLGRPLRDLRISVTDRCNFRCVYCMPKEVFGKDFQFLPRAEILTFEEIERLARIFVALGVQKIRLTGGEPLVRRNLEVLVEKLAKIGELDLTLTTNGSLLSQKARPLAEAGLRRVTVSLDSLDDATFKRMNDADFPVAKVLAGIEAAHAAGLAPIKINMVTKRGVNETSIVPMARYFKGTGMTLRFIEFMDVGSTNGWRLDDVVPAREIIAMIDREMPLEPVQSGYRGEVAARYRYKDGGGEIGVISSVTQPFCADCTRARLSADGALYTCLFATQGHDLRALLRSGASDEEISSAIAAVWTERTDRYSDLRSEQTAGLHKIEMSFIGG